jgi:hypothetical protein
MCANYASKYGNLRDVLLLSVGHFEKMCSVILVNIYAMNLYCEWCKLC